MTRSFSDRARPRRQRQTSGVRFGVVTAIDDDDDLRVVTIDGVDMKCVNSTTLSVGDLAAWLPGRPPLCLGQLTDSPPGGLPPL